MHCISTARRVTSPCPQKVTKLWVATWLCIYGQALLKMRFVPFSECLLLPCRYGFGEAGKPKYGIQGNAELVYEVTLKSFEKVRAEVLQSLPGLQEWQGL